VSGADWPRAADWLAGASDDPAALVVAGVPLTDLAVTPAGYEHAPGAIRDRLRKLSTWHGERQVALDAVPVRDLGDALVPPPLSAPLTVLLGGHNAVTWHALAGAGAGGPALDRWGLLTLDAHHDVRPYELGAVGNGSPVRALIDAGLRGTNVVQVGVHGFSNSRAHRDWCEAQGVTVLGADRILDVTALLDDLAARCDAIYVDVDLDVLDRASAPACPGSRPGGVSPRQLLDAAFAAGAHHAVRGIDIVELDPLADVAHITTDTAALALLNVAAGFATREPGRAPRPGR
jgi:arginase family enzyme